MADAVGADIAALIVALQASVPQAMRAAQQWLLWRFERYEGDKKPRKVPYYVSGRKRKGAQGGRDDRNELATFDIAVTHLAQGLFDGLGFAFLPGDGLIGIDIDGAIDAETGEVSERCTQIIEACASYTEYSPSGRGVHIIVSGESETFKDNSIGLEVFCGRQFFTVTGRRWPGTPEQVAPIADGVLRRLRKTVDVAKQGKRPVRAAAPPAAANEPNDFQRVNAAALALLDQWVPSLFPDAKRHAGTGAWRVSSKALGRDLQEDLSLHRDGISDFGTERASIYGSKGLTCIDVVVEFGHKSPKEALEWLADRIGMSLTKPPRKRREARAAASEEAGSTPSTASGEGGDGPPGEDPPADEPPEPKLPHWRKKLLGDGGKKDCRENVYLYLLNHPKLKGLVGYDEFAHQVLKLREPPWKSPPGEWTNNDDYYLAYWLAEHERITFKAEGTIVAGVAMAAFENSFHPVHDYLNALPAWDGVERLPHWLTDCLGAADTTYTRLVGTWFVMGMVKRVRDPGCQMDYMVVLEGLQGKQKSTALRVLAVRDEWFADTPVRVGTPDAILSIAGKWLYEIGEMDSFNRAEATAVKQYVSSRSDRVREPYARRPADRKRSGVFAGSTNQAEYFKDPTGARRFWPVACDGEVNLVKLREWRDQLFAEAIHRLASTDEEIRRYWPTRAEEEQYLVPQQERREIVDPWFEHLAQWLERDAIYGESGTMIKDVDNFTSFDLLTKALHVPQDRIDGGRQMATRVGNIMHRLGWEKRRDGAPPRIWRYWRPSPKTGGGAGPAISEASGGPTPNWSADDFAAGGVADE